MDGTDSDTVIVWFWTKRLWVLPGTYGWVVSVVGTMNLDQMDCGTWDFGIGTILQGIAGTWDDFFF